MPLEQGEEGFCLLPAIFVAAIFVAALCLPLLRTIKHKAFGAPFYPVATGCSSPLLFSPLHVGRSYQVDDYTSSLFTPLV